MRQVVSGAQSQFAPVYENPSFRVYRFKPATAAGVPVRGK
jgi:hypothetical protein